MNLVHSGPIPPEFNYSGRITGFWMESMGHCKVLPHLAVHFLHHLHCTIHVFLISQLIVYVTHSFYLYLYLYFQRSSYQKGLITQSLQIDSALASSISTQYFHLYFLASSRYPTILLVLQTRRGSYHFNDKSQAVPGHLMCIMPKVGKKILSFFWWEFNEILNEIAVANYDNFHYLPAKI